jgi:hypothetical protein
VTDPIPLFVELCAGTAAVSLRLHRDGAKPPVSRMGSKSGYASALLRILGLRPGQRAAAYLWCEPDPGVRLLLEAYRDGALAKAAAAIIRSWAAEDPRALWERLRAEGPPRCPDGGVEAGEVARHLFVVGGSMLGDGKGIYGGNLIGWTDGANGAGDKAPLSARLPKHLEALPVPLPAAIAPDARQVDPREVARWAQITASNRLIHTAWSDTEGRWVNTGDGGCTFGGPAFCSPPERTAEGMEAAPGDVPAVVVPDARAVDPREVARLLYMAPVAARPDGVHVRDRHAIAGCNHLAGLGARANGPHVVLGQDGGRMLDPNLSGTVGDLVADVDRLGGPCEILGPVVITAPVEVAGHHSGRAGPVKRGTYQSADTPVDALSSGAHDELLIPVFAESTNQGPVGVGRLDLPHVADHVLGSLGDDAPFLSHMDTSTATISYGGASVQLPPGTICYMDPSYVGTTGYADNLGRAEVITIARRWAAAGATVAISEAEAIPELVAEGWHAVRIDGERVGQKRTFSKQQEEWVTLNRPPAWVPPTQGRLF